MSAADRLRADVVDGGTCTGCGACALLSPDISMQPTALGPKPRIPQGARIDDGTLLACPGLGIDVQGLYLDHYGHLPANWITGEVVRARTGFSSDPTIRKNSSSGGVITSVLLYLLESRQIDGAFVVQQGVPTPEQASVVLARTRAEIIAASQSVYIPVSVLDGLALAVPGERYAMTVVPDQAASLRALQRDGHAAAQQIEHLIGPYTGTAIYPGAIRTLLRSQGVKSSDPITSLKWRAGDWPGYLEVVTASGRVVRSKKVYYNFLIPFFVTQNSLQNIDFVNEFCDLSVGDAWSPKFEGMGGGHSVFVTRSESMESVIQQMEDADLLTTEPIDAIEAADMHGHMLDFKKRGGHIRNSWRRRTGRSAPQYGVRPEPLPRKRVAVEVIVSSIFLVGGTRPARWLVSRIPEHVIGPLFNRARLTWKSLSRPTKRDGLRELAMKPDTAS